MRIILTNILKAGGIPPEDIQIVLKRILSEYDPMIEYYAAELRRMANGPIN
jgi:hypothetical protein